MQTELLSLLRALLGALGTSDKGIKRQQLFIASRHLDTLKLLFCLARDTRCLSGPAYQQCESAMADIGRMLGGWTKSLS